ncbi:MAG: glycine cleavage system protein GcvH [Myxococcales bacterium]|nr:glycine cleavage system protein GcvH [Myxococcales bacterium]MCB9643521.1 glycine cleavage system protein GcvH [Myxococcales bacterium]
MKFPENLRYTEDHEWIDPSTGRIGITDHAQDQLGDVVYLDFSMNVGDASALKDVLGTIESVKTVSDIYAPVSGKITEVNSALEKSPELVNKDPYGEGWLFCVELDDPSQLDGLMDAETYKKHTGH